MANDRNVLQFPQTARATQAGRFVIPSRIRDARKLLRLSQQDLADKIGVTRQSISAYESGKKTPEPETFTAIVTSLNQPIFYFTSADRPVFGDISPYFFRKRGPETERRNEACAVLGNWFTQIAFQLNGSVNFPVVTIPETATSQKSGRYSDDEIEEAANGCRQIWGLGPGPISNVLALIESKGIITCRYDLAGEKVDAFSFWSGDRPFIFMATEREAVVRTRFDLAHELGHLVLHRWVEQSELTDPKTLKLIESEADRFAGAFLLPKSSFPNEVYTARLDAFLLLKKRWKVSVQAMVYRSKNLELIDEQQFVNLYKSISFRKWRSKEPFDNPAELPLEEPKLLAKAVHLLIASGRKTPSDLVHDFGISSELSETLCGLIPGCLADASAPTENEPRLK